MVADVCWVVSWGGCEIEQRGEFPRGHNPRGFVAAESEQLLVAGDQKLGLAGFGERKQIAVFQVRRDRAGRKVPAIRRKS